MLAARQALQLAANELPQTEDKVRCWIFAPEFGCNFASIIGVKQGDLLGPILFNFHVAGAMMAWQQERQSVPPVFQTKEDCVLDGREWRKEVESEPLEVPDTLYADDTGEFFKTRADAVQDVPLLVEFLAKFGLFVHVKLPGQKKSKSVLMYHSAPKASYSDFSAFDGECFDDIEVRGG